MQHSVLGVLFCAKVPNFRLITTQKLKKTMQNNRLKKKIYEKIVSGDLDSVIAKIRQIEKKETLDWNLMYWAGLCFYLKKDLDLAQYYFEKSIRAGESKNQFVATVYSALGIVQQEKGEFIESIKLLKKSISLREQSTTSDYYLIGDEDLQSIHHRLATTYSLQAEKERDKERKMELDSLALDHFFQALKLEGYDLEGEVPKILNRISQSPDGQKLFEKGNVETIVLNKLRYESSRFILFMSNFATQFYKIGEVEEAIKWMEIAIGYIDKDHEQWISLNKELEQMKREQE